MNHSISELFEYPETWVWLIAAIGWTSIKLCQIAYRRWGD
jgi:hypothetical protein